MAPLQYPGAHFADWQWTEVVRWRLEVAALQAGIRCHNCTREGQRCAQILDADHAALCTVGPLEVRRHNDVAEAYGDVMQDDCGALVRREVYVPELSRTKEAWLDVWAYGVHGLPDLLLDVTIRHPRCERYLPNSSQIPGHAAAQAEKEKEDKYPSAAGRSAWPVAYETWGRAGQQAELLLCQLAAAARHRAHRQGRAVGRELPMWRARIDGTLQRGVAQQLVTARQGLPGKSLYRERPLDLARVEAQAPV